MSKKPSISNHIKYHFDNFMSKGGFSIFIALLTLFAIAFLVMSIVRYVANSFFPDEIVTSVADQLWRVFLQISDAGAVAEDGESSIINKVIAIVTIFLGLVLFSSLVAFITSQFEMMLDELKKGKSRVIENNHTLILGFNDRVLEIIRELIVANESEKRASIVVLSQEEKDVMDDYFREHIDTLKSTKIITRSGVSSSIKTLNKMSVNQARSVIILNDAEANADNESKELADARVIKSVMTVVACCRGGEVPPIVAELHMESKQRLAQQISKSVCIIKEHSMLAKLIVQTSRISGLALIYDSLVGFEGSEFYFFSSPNGWDNKTYGELQLYFNECSVLGVRTSDGRVLVNPRADLLVEHDMELLLIAEDDSLIKQEKKPFTPSKIEHEPAKPLPKKIEKQLVVGWSQKAPTIVDEYAEYLCEGSTIDVVVYDNSPDIDDEFSIIKANHPTIMMRLICVNPHDLGVLEEMKPETYDNVIILKQDGGDSELRDSETIAMLLQFRYYFQRCGVEQINTQLISEVADSENLEVIIEVGVNDFLISNKFVSKLYAQVSEEPDVLRVYDDLFNEEGSEIYIKPLSLFMKSIPLKLQFGDLCFATQKRNETCFGVRIKSEETDPSKGYGIYINPPKTKVFKLSQEDSLLTLAEDEC